MSVRCKWHQISTLYSHPHSPACARDKRGGGTDDRQSVRPRSDQKYSSMLLMVCSDYIQKGRLKREPWWWYLSKTKTKIKTRMLLIVGGIVSQRFDPKSPKIHPRFRSCLCCFVCTGVIRHYHARRVSNDTIPLPPSGPCETSTPGQSWLRTISALAPGRPWEQRSMARPRSAAAYSASGLAVVAPRQPLLRPSWCGLGLGSLPAADQPGPPCVRSACSAGPGSALRPRVPGRGSRAAARGKGYSSQTGCLMGQTFASARA